MAVDFFLKLDGIKGESYNSVVKENLDLFDSDSAELLLLFGQAVEDEFGSDDGADFKYFAAEISPNENANDRVTETVSLNFAKVEVDYTPQDTSGDDLSKFADSLAFQFEEADIDAEISLLGGFNASDAADDNPLEYMKIKLTDVLISSRADDTGDDLAADLEDLLGPLPVASQTVIDDFQF